MKPIDFPQSTKELARPANMTDEECSSLHVYCDGDKCISCWKPSLKERFRILFGNPVWLGVISGRTQPPVFVDASNIFEPEEKTTSRMMTEIRIFIADAKDAWESVKRGCMKEDKRKCFGIAFLVSLIIGIMNPYLGFGVGCVAYMLKKWWNNTGYGSIELSDVFFTCMGSLMAMVATLMLNETIMTLWQR